MQVENKNIPLAVFISFVITFAVFFFSNHFIFGNAIEKSIRDAVPLSIVLPFFLVFKVETFKSIALTFYALIIGALTLLSSILLDLAFSSPLNWHMASKQGIITFVSAAIVFLIFKAFKR